MTFDATRYEREVLMPGLRRGSLPPADLLARYADPPLIAGPSFDSHVEEVRRHWRRLTHSQKYARLAAALLIADKQLREEVRRTAGDQDASQHGEPAHEGDSRQSRVHSPRFPGAMYSRREGGANADEQDDGQGPHHAADPGRWRLQQDLRTEPADEVSPDLPVALTLLDALADVVADGA